MISFADSARFGRLLSFRLVLRFINCESGATTSEYSFMAAAVVALGVATVGTTQSGATVSAENTAATIEAQAPIFEDLAESQQAARHDWRTRNSGGSGSVSVPRKKQPTKSSVDNKSDDAKDGQTQNTGTQQATNKQSGKKAAESTDAPTTQQSNKTNKPAAKSRNEQKNNGTKKASDKNDTFEPTVVAETSNKECKNPKNKKGKTKKKCL